MWKVTNIENSKYLNEFRKKIIEPMLDEILNYKKHKENHSRFLDYLNTSDSLYSNENNILKYISGVKREKTISDLVDLLTNKNLMYIKKQVDLYYTQVNLLDVFNYNIEEKKIDNNLKIIFTNFFYTTFFNDSHIWISICNSDFGREKFHLNFKSENELEVCPYCDIDTIISKGNRNIEHFLPKSKYPFLAMHSNNLYSACQGCNGSYGKSINYLIPITSPYVEQIGDKIQFEIDNHLKSINLITNNNIRIENYISLIKLREKYSTESVCNAVNRIGIRTYKILDKIEKNCDNNFDTNEFYELLDFKKEPLTFATKDIFDDIKEYKKYIGSKKKL